MLRRSIHSISLAGLGLLLPLSACDAPGDEPAPDPTTSSSSSSTSGGDSDTSGDVLDGGSDESSTGEAPVELVPVDLSVRLLLGNNYATQIDELFRASFTSGSGMGRMRIFARFCADPECEQPLALTAGLIEEADEDGMYVFSSASPAGTGFDHGVSFSEAPLGTSYLQIIGDTQRSIEWGKGECTGLDDCPGDADVVQIGDFQIDNGMPGSAGNPAAATIELNVGAAGQTISLEDPLFLGRVHFSGQELWTPAPADGGRLLAGMSNADDTFRNFMALIDLSDASGTAGTPSDDSYTLQHDGADFLGDVCGMVRGGESLYAIGVGSEGAHIFELDGTTGIQLSDQPLVVIPPVGDDYPWPCRGVYVDKGGNGHLYLLQFQGAGSLDTSSPSPLYHVDLDQGSVDTPFGAYTDWAWRAVAVDEDATQLYVVDMSWSLDASNSGVGFDRIIPIPIDPDGSLGPAGDPVLTDLTSDNQCDSQLNWASGATMASIGGTPQLLVGHDDGVAVYDPQTLAKQSDLDLTSHGILFSSFAPSPDGQLLYAMPQCKSVTGNSDFELPQGAATEKADKNLVAVLDLSGPDLAVASTDIDINGDGTNDDGIDLDYYRIKSYIREFSSTLPIPPVVYTGPQMAVGESMLFVRGSGIQGNGMGALSSSGMGQAQDIAFFDRATGEGLVFGEYMPFFDGLSSEAGQGTGIWGYDVWPGTEASVGWIEYLPAQ